MKQREKLAKIMLAGFVMATGVSLFSNMTAHAGDLSRTVQIQDIDSRVSSAGYRLDKVSAMTAAIAKLEALGYSHVAPSEFSVSVSQYEDEAGLALGVFYYPSRDFMLSASVSTFCNETMGGVGATWKLKRKSTENPESMENAKDA